MKPLHKYFPLFVAFLILAIVSIGFYGGSVVRSIFFERIVADLENSAEIVKNLILRNNDGDIDDFCKAAGTLHSRITIVDTNGVVLGDSIGEPEMMDNHNNRPEIVEAYAGRTGYSIRYSETLKRKLVYLAMPQFNLQGTPVVLRTAVAFRSLRLDLKGAYAQIAFAGAVILVLISLLAYLFIRRINDSLHIVSRAVREYGKGNLTFKPTIRKPAALKQVADTISALAGDLHSRIAEISRQRDELEAVFGSMEEAVIVLDTKMTIREMNQAALKLTEFDLGEAIGKELLLVVRNSELFEIAGEVIATKNRVEREIELFQDSEHHLQVHGSVIKGPGEEVNRIVLVLNDVSRLKELERVRRDFVANVSHELKTPITAVKGYVETVLEGGDNDKETAESFLRIALQHADRLSAIVEDLLIISRLEKDTGPAPERSICDVQELAGGVAAMYQSRADEMHGVLSVDCPEDVYVEGNRVLLEQAVANLVDNALKYSNEGGTVTISVVTAESSVAINVIDTGAGIPTEHLNRIFERFYRVDKGRSRELGGTGLGLSIVKHIVSSHGGKVKVQSVEGKGSTFTIVLPLGQLSL